MVESHFVILTPATSNHSEPVPFKVALEGAAGASGSNGRLITTNRLLSPLRPLPFNMFHLTSPATSRTVVYSKRKHGCRLLPTSLLEMQLQPNASSSDVGHSGPFLSSSLTNPCANASPYSFTHVVVRCYLHLALSTRRCIYAPSRSLQDTLHSRYNRIVADGRHPGPSRPFSTENANKCCLRLSA
jgi:hypothetical protein